MEQHLQSSCHPPGKPVRLKVKNVTFLDKGPFSFTLEEGECLGMCGQSGVGKSLLLKALTDLIAFEGDVLLDDVSVATYEAPEWRSLVTMVPAESFWWYDRVNQHFPLNVRSSGFEKHLENLGFSIDVLDWEISRMSTGEKQRLSLLRSLQNSPQILLLDEPTSNLDGQTTELVERFITEYRVLHGGSMVWVSHDQEQLQRIAGRHLQMKQEGLVELPLG